MGSVALVEPLAGLEALRTRELRRAVVLSALAHLLVLALLWSIPAPGPRMVLPGVVTVELVAPPPGRARTRARPRPKPVAPVEKKVVLPAQPSDPLPETKPKPEVAKPEPVEPKPAEQHAYEDVLEQLRAERGEERPQAPQVARVEPALAGAVAGAGGVRVSPEVEAWLRRARIHVRGSWVLAPGFRIQPLETHLVVRLDASGAVIGAPKITRRSGNPWYDESVMRAVRKASPLPAPPEAGEWPFVFRPEDSF